MNANQIQIGDIVKANGKTYGQVWSISEGRYQVMTDAGNLIVTKQVVFFKKPTRPLSK